MAGTYDDIPGTRFALDQDGTTAKFRDYTAGNVWTDATSSINASQSTTTATYMAYTPVGAANYVQLAIAFPEPRTINGIYLHAGTSSATSAWTNQRFEYSSDTVDGTDGTWLPFSATFVSYSQHDQGTESSKPYYRNDIVTTSLTGVRGVRIRGRSSDGYSVFAQRIYTLHLYGSRPIAGINRLSFWHSSLSQKLSPAALDFGDVPQGSSATRQFRIKNLSSTMAANGVAVSVSDLVPEYGAGEIQMSTDGTSYLDSISIGNLAANATSSVLYIRRTVPTAQAIGLRNARLIVNATSWS